MFRTQLDLSKRSHSFDHATHFFSIGSCFSENIGSRLQALAFHLINNPYGILFNPISISEALQWSLAPYALNEDRMVESQGVFRHFSFHSKIRGLTKEELIKNSKHIHFITNQALQETDALIITLGSAFIYEYKNKVVANCHKIPQQQFQKRLLELHEITEALKETINALSHIKQVVLTVSPVRHLKNTLELNSVSKSLLRLACHELSNHFNHVDYFPAYELVLDDLRDYRFYKEDLLHPNKQAQDYVYEKFATSYLSEDTLTICKAVNQLNAAIQHQPFNPATPEHLSFLTTMLEKATGLNERINLTTQITTLKKLINTHGTGK